MADVDLTDLAAVKAFYGGDAGDDATLSPLITAVSVQFENYTNRPLAAQGGVIRPYRPGPFQTVIVLDEFTEFLSSVTQDGDTLVVNTDVELRDDQRLVRISGNRDLNWIAGAKVVVQASEGFVNIPEDLEEACIEQVVLTFRQTKQGGGRFAIEDRTPESGVTERWTLHKLTDNTIDVLNRGYVRKF